MQDLRKHYRSAMTDRDYQYFDTYSHRDQALVIDEAKDRIQEENLSRLKESISSTPITKLLGMVSHELRTPLNAIVGTIDLMRDASNSKDQGLCVQSLEQGSMNLQAIMNRLQDVAALSHEQNTVNIMPFDIVAVVTGVAEYRQDQAENDRGGTSVTLELDPKLPLSVESDLSKIQQTLSNLIATTIASSAEKRCHVKVDVVRNDPDLLIRVLVQSQSNARPTPLLDGIGLEFTAESLMQPMQPSNMYQGLVITREYLRLLGSRLDTTWSQDDGKLAFTFDLKVNPSKDVSGKGIDTADNQSNFGNYVRDPSSVKVLLVEDNQVNMRIAKAILKRLGFDASTAANGLEAISSIHDTVFDIVFMDCDMPICTGYDATRHIRNKMGRNDVIIIALTANTTNDAKKKCLSVGMNDFFVKPITTKTVDEMMHKWLTTTPNDGKKGPKRLA